MQISVQSRFFAALVAFTALACASAAHADTAKDFNLYTLHDFTASGSDVEGRVAVGGNATLNGYSIALKQPSSSGTPQSLVVNGALKFTNGSVWNGNIVAGAGSSLTNVNGPDGNPTTISSATSPIDFATENARLLALSADLGASAATGTTNFQYGGLTLTGASTGLNIFTVSGADLASANGFTINAPAGAFALVNISGAIDAIQNMGMNLSGITASNVLLNFYQATSLTIGGISIQGAILAPKADVKFNNGAINGAVIAGSLTGYGQINYVPYAGTLLDPKVVTSSVPEPATWAMLLCGFGLVGGALRRRRVSAQLA